MAGRSDQEARRGEGVRRPALTAPMAAPARGARRLRSGGATSSHRAVSAHGGGCGGPARPARTQGVGRTGEGSAPRPAMTRRGGTVRTRAARTKRTATRAVGTRRDAARLVATRLVATRLVATRAVGTTLVATTTAATTRDGTRAIATTRVATTGVGPRPAARWRSVADGAWPPGRRRRRRRRDDRAGGARVGRARLRDEVAASRRWRGSRRPAPDPVAAAGLSRGATPGPGLGAAPGPGLGAPPRPGLGAALGADHAAISWLRYAAVTPTQAAARWRAVRRA